MIRRRLLHPAPLLPCPACQAASSSRLAHHASSLASSLASSASASSPSTSTSAPAYTLRSRRRLADRIGEHLQRRYFSPPAARERPSSRFFYYSRPDFLPSAPYSSAATENAAGDYESRYLPPQSSRLEGQRSFDGGPSHPAHSLAQALRNDDPHAAWSAYCNLTEDCADALDFDGADQIIDALWWCLATHTNPTDIRQQRIFDEELLDYLLLLSDKMQRPAVPATTSVAIPWTHLHKHRLLYLLTTDMERASRMQGSNRHGLMQTAVSPPSIARAKYQAIEALTDSRQTAEEPIDAPLVERLSNQLAIHGLPRLALDFWQNQSKLRRMLSGRKDGEPWDPLRMSDRHAQNLLVNIAADPLRKAAGIEPAYAPHGRLNPYEAVRCALEVVDAAMDHHLALAPMYLTGWMQHATLQDMWSLLPEDIVTDATAVDETWTQPNAAHFVQQQQDRFKGVAEDIKYALCDFIVLEMAQRGDVRPALVLHNRQKASPRNVQNPEFLRTILEGVCSNIQGLSVLLERREVPAELWQKLDPVAIARTLTELTSEQPKQTGPDANLTIKMLRSLQRLWHNSPRSRDPEHATRDVSEWLYILRRLTSSLLAQDPALGAGPPSLPAVRISGKSHGILILLHAYFGDYGFAKTLWRKWTQLSARNMPRRQQRTGLPPRYFYYFDWLFAATLQGDRTKDLLFAGQLYLDHCAHAPAREIPHNLLVMFMRQLAKAGMVHFVKRLVRELQIAHMRLTPMLARGLLEAFRFPDTLSAEHSLSIAEGLCQLQDDFRARKALGPNLHGSNEGQAAVASPSPRADDARQDDQLPLEVFSYPLSQCTSRKMTDWNSIYHIRFLDLFNKCIRVLQESLQARAVRPFGLPGPMGPPLAEEAVRQAFNSAMRIHLEWPKLRMFSAGWKEDPECLLGDFDADVLNQDLVPYLAPAVRPLGGVLETTPETRGEARRGAILQIAQVLEGPLSVSGDGETWSLKLLACMLPGDAQSDKQRMSEALAVYEASLTAEFDYSRNAALKPWAKMPLQALRGGSDSEQALSAPQALPPDVGRVSNSRGSSAPAPTSKLSLEHTADEQASSEATSGLPSQGHSSQGAPSRNAVMKPVLLRARTVARFILNLSRISDFSSADWVYTTWLERIEAENTLRKQLFKELAAVSRKVRMHTPRPRNLYPLSRRSHRAVQYDLMTDEVQALRARQRHLRARLYTPQSRKALGKGNFVPLDRPQMQGQDWGAAQMEEEDGLNQEDSSDEPSQKGADGASSRPGAGHRDGQEPSGSTGESRHPMPSLGLDPTTVHYARVISLLMRGVASCEEEAWKLFKKLQKDSLRRRRARGRFEDDTASGWEQDDDESDPMSEVGAGAGTPGSDIHRRWEALRTRVRQRVPVRGESQS